MAAPASTRPDVVLFDIFETVLQLEPLRGRLIDVGRLGHELELFFTWLLRDGMALTLAGQAPPFRDVATAALRTVSGNTLSKESIGHVLDGFAELPPHPDVEPAWLALADAGVPAWAFTHGSAEAARTALERAELLGLLRGVRSAESLGSFKPPPRCTTGCASRSAHRLPAPPWSRRTRGILTARCGPACSLATSPGWAGSRPRCSTARPSSPTPWTGWSTACWHWVDLLPLG